MLARKWLIANVSCCLPPWLWCQRKKNISYWLFFYIYEGTFPNLNEDCTRLSRLAFFPHSDNDPRMWKPNTQWYSIYNYVKHSKTAHFQTTESGTNNNLTFFARSVTFTVHQISKLLYVSIYAKPLKEKAEAARRVVGHKVDEVEEIPDIFFCYFLICTSMWTWLSGWGKRCARRNTKSLWDH